MIKKIYRVILILLLTFCIISVTDNINHAVNAATELVSLEKYDGSGNVTYRGTNIEVKIPSTYVSKTSEFRGVWVSAYAGDIKGYIYTEELFKTELLAVLNVMEDYNLNSIIFHIRTHNDALYDTKLAPKSNYINSADFKKWDYLTWFINECHARGIEFHAWMNPYRLGDSTVVSSYTSKYSSYPKNPASKAENIVVGSKGAILNPGEPAVREYLVDVCMEVIKKYNIDAIHFDDYFYIAGVQDGSTYTKYKANYGDCSHEEFRRLQIDEFIEDLSETMKEYNLANGRCVQLGISPSGIYRNGSYSSTYKYDSNQNLISPLTSNSNGYSHYDSPLYSDTKKWIDNEWIDYIIPQLYASFENTVMPYADMVDWWANVVKYKKVNLYTGIGLYKKNSSVDDYPDAGWHMGTKQLRNQLLYNTKYEEVQGFSIYQYKTIKTYATDSDVLYVKNNYLSQEVLPPKIRRYDMSVSNIDSLDIYKGSSSYSLSWENSSDKYAIYRSTGTIDLNDGKQIIDIVGNGANATNHYIDNNIDITKTYKYAVVPISKNNMLGNEITISSSNALTSIPFEIGEFTKLDVSGTIKKGNRLTINFNEISLYAGNQPTYIVYQSYDGENWDILVEYNEPETGGSYSKMFYYPKDRYILYLKVVATNEFGQLTSETIKLSVRLNGPVAILEDIFNDYQEFISNMYN